ncbi:MAG TPA: tRNA lysidine(34) synthetase TilS [Clostridiaceae bacterium]|nr:tRNA lysidine(34) synthetase TilS [Clostridiaceae bacterium]
MVKKVLETIKKYNLIEKGDTVLVGVSGGPDSVCLLHILYKLKDELEIELYAAHVNHMLRGEFSDNDQEYVTILCKQFNIPLFTKKCNIMEMAASQRLSLEETGRKARYDFFESCSQEINADKIAVAHNKNDQAETILMNIIRGTGTDGLKGMEHRRGKIIRPLLDIRREEIEKYCADNNLNPRIDASNNESIYTRNKVRLELVPFIDRLFDTKVVESIYKMSLLVRDDYDFIDSYTEAQYKSSIEEIGENSVSLSISKITSNHPAIIKRIIRKAIADIRGDINGIHNRHIQDAYMLCIEGRTGAEIHLPGGLKVLKSYNILKIFHSGKEDVAADFESPVTVPGVTRVCTGNMEIIVNAITIDKFKTDLPDKNVNSDVENYKKLRYNSLIQFFDYDKLYTGINIRNRRNGDVFYPYKSSGTKKLKDYFIDNKIPREIRNSIPLIAMNNNIVWVIGYRINDKYKVTENTKNVLKLEVTIRKLKMED